MEDKKIIISKNGTIVTPYIKGQNKSIEKITSIYDKVYHKQEEVTGFVMDYDGVSSFITHYFNTMSLMKTFKNYSFEELRAIAPKRIKEFNLNDTIILNDIQLSMTHTILKYKNHSSNEWFVNLPTAKGKTLLGINILSSIEVKTFITCFSTTILSQWIESLREKTTFDMNRVVVIDSSDILIGIYEGTFDSSRYDVFICTPNTILAFIRKHGSEKIESVFRYIGIGMIIYDEAHRNMGYMVKLNALTNIKYTLYLSADYGQGKEELENKYFRIFNNVKIIKPSKEELDLMKYTQAIVVEYNSYPMDLEKDAIFNKYGFSAQKYIDYQLTKKYLLGAIDYILTHICKSNQNKYKTLILLTNIDHVDIIHKHINDNNIDLNVCKIYSGIKDRQELIEMSDVIVSTYKSFGTGVDTKLIKYVIGLNQSNKIEDNQAAGRARPLPDESNVFYFMVIDKGFGYCKKKLNERLHYLSENKVTQITKIKFII